MQTFHDVVQFAMNDGHFELLARLLGICIMFQASSTDCEWGFSLMNAMKTKSRDWLQIDHLDMQSSRTYHINNVTKCIYFVPLVSPASNCASLQWLECLQINPLSTYSSRGSCGQLLLLLCW